MLTRLWIVAILALVAGCGSSYTPASREAAARDHRSELLSRQANQADAATTPYLEEMRFPDDWPDISDRRDRVPQ
ncbi:MAG: hypothetical protein ACHRHE_04075 [Tepidisphaerales bacterium]